MKQLIAVFSFFILSDICFADNGRFYKSNQKIVFSYEEFRKLSSLAQEQWIKELRIANRNLDLIDAGLRPNEHHIKGWSFFETFKDSARGAGMCSLMGVFLRGEYSQAQSSAQCKVTQVKINNKSQICLKCPGDQFTRVDSCTNNLGTAQEIATELIKNMYSPQNKAGKVLISPEVLEASVTSAMAGNVEKIDAKPTSLVAVSPAKAAAKAPDLKPLPEGMKNEIKDASAVLPMSAKTEKFLNDIEKTENKKLQERLKGDEEKRNKGPRALDDTGNLKGNDNIDVEEVVNGDKLACIYAGWAVRSADKCSPIHEKEMRDPVGKRVFYTCSQSSDSTKDGAPVMSGFNSDEKANVLCNPVIFGLKDRKPICIARSATATKDCAEQAGSAADALAMAKANPQEYRALTKRMSSLCQSDEKILWQHFKKRGKSENQIEKSLKDISATCVHLRERMASLEKENSASAETGRR